MKQEMASAVGSAVIKTAPPVAVWTAAATGAIDMTFLVGALTCIFLVAQISYLLWKWFWEWKAKRKVNK